MAIYVASSSATIVDNLISDAHTGIVALVSSCVLERNTISRCTYGVQVVDRATASILNNDMVGNRIAIDVDDRSRVTIADNRIRGDGFGTGIAMGWSEGTCTNNEICNNVRHVALFRGARATVADNRFRYGIVGIFAADATTCTRARNRCRGVWIPWLNRWHLKAACVATLGVALPCLAYALSLAFRV